MMRVDDLVEAISALQRSDLEAWIREELVAPQQEAGTLLFTDMECARVRLICTLHYELEIDVDTLPHVGGAVLVSARQRRPQLEHSGIGGIGQAQVGEEARRRG